MEWAEGEEMLGTSKSGGKRDDVEHFTPPTSTVLLMNCVHVPY